MPHAQHERGDRPRSILGALLVVLLAPGASVAYAPSALADAAPAVRASPQRARGGNSPKQQQRRIDEAVRLHDEARELYARGDYRAAIEKLEVAIELDPSAKELVYNLALIHEKLLEFDQAELHYLRYLEMETDPELKEQARATIRRIEGAKRDVLAKAKQKNKKKGPRARALADAPAPTNDTPGSRPNVAFWISGSLAATAFAVGTVYGVSALSLDPSDDVRTGGSVGVADLQRDAAKAHTHAVVADVAFIASAAFTGLAAYLFVQDRKGRPAAFDRQARPRPRHLTPLHVSF